MMNARAIVVGWLFLTCGLVIGGVWATQIGGSPDPRAQAMTWRTRRFSCALISWATYSFALVRAPRDRLERAPRRLAVRDRVHPRAAEFRPGRVLPDPEPQLLGFGNVEISEFGNLRSPNLHIPKFPNSCMRLFAVGISHRTAPVELRECVDFARRGIDAALAALAARKLTREAVVLSTCNRAEIYAAAESDDGRRVLRPLHQRIQRRRLGRARAARRHLPRDPRRRTTCSGWPRASTRWSSASRRSSGRSRTRSPRRAG